MGSTSLEITAIQMTWESNIQLRNNNDNKFQYSLMMVNNVLNISFDKYEPQHQTYFFNLYPLIVMDLLRYLCCRYYNDLADILSGLHSDVLPVLFSEFLKRCYQLLHCCL